MKSVYLFPVMGAGTNCGPGYLVGALLGLFITYGIYYIIWFDGPRKFFGRLFAPLRWFYGHALCWPRYFFRKYTPGQFREWVNAHPGVKWRETPGRRTCYYRNRRYVLRIVE